MPELHGNVADAVWILSKMRWGHLDSMGGIDIKGIIAAMDLYKIPKTRQGDLLSVIVNITKQAMTDKGK